MAPKNTSDCTSDTALDDLPKRAPREELARLVTRYYFQISPRTLERWPIRWLHLNGRAHGEVAEVFALAEAKLAEAPPVMGGRRIEVA
jgi:hypothetical protein